MRPRERFTDHPILTKGTRAIHAGLTAPELKSSVDKMARIDLSNPLTALVAIGLSWSGLIVWTVRWFVLMPLFSFLLGKSAKQPARGT
jgi:hypothetical protein